MLINVFRELSLKNYIMDVVLTKDFDHRWFQDC